MISILPCVLRCCVTAKCCVVTADKDRILGEIGTETQRLNNTVHGVVAAAALELVLKRGHKVDTYLGAVAEGNVQRLRVDASNHSEDTQANADRVAAAVGEHCEVLELTFEQMVRLQEGFYLHTHLFMLHTAAMTKPCHVLQALGTAQPSKNSA